MRKRIEKIWLDDSLYIRSDKGMIRELKLLVDSTNELIDEVNELSPRVPATQNKYSNLKRLPSRIKQYVRQVCLCD